MQSITCFQKFKKIYFLNFCFNLNTFRGLAGRLASTEDELEQLCEDYTLQDDVWMMMRKKKDKLEHQLSEALWIKKKIDKRYPKVISFNHTIDYQNFEQNLLDRINHLEVGWRNRASQL